MLTDRDPTDAGHAAGAPGAAPLADPYQAALHETALDLLRRRDVRDLLETILSRAGAIAGTTHGYVYLLDDEGLLAAEIVSGTFRDDHGSRVRRDEGLVGRVWGSGRALVIENYDRWEGRYPGYPMGRIGSGVGVPLVTSRGEVIGVIGLAHTETAPRFTHADVDRLTAFAQLATVALENARLHEAATREIDRRAQAQEALRQTEENYRRLVELSPDGIAVHADGRMLFANARAAAMVGLADASELVGRPFLDFVHPGSRSAVVERTRRMSEGGEAPGPAEERFLRSDGAPIDVEVAATALTFEGRPAIQVVFRDISERKRTERALYRAQERYRSLVERLPAVTYTVGDPQLADDQQPEDFVSPQIVDLIGCTPEEWLANPMAWREFVHPDDIDDVVAGWHEASHRDVPFEHEYRMVARDGRLVWVRDQAVPVRGQGGEPDVWQGVMTDITARREVEETLRAAFDREREISARLRALDELKNTFLAAVSHELRTPLSAILGFALTLERRDLTLEPDDMQDMLGRLAANARKLDRLLSDLLDLDRLGRGIVEPRRRPTDVAALVRSVVEGTDALRDHPVELDLAEVTADVDGAKVERIVENLVVNAARHTPAGCPILVGLLGSGGGVTITVDDQGPGVPEDMRGAVFEPFRQLAGRGSHAPGVGIGLSLVARFAELHGGRAWVQPRECGGASFRVWLPNVAPADEAGADPVA